MSKCEPANARYVATAPPEICDVRWQMMKTNSIRILFLCAWTPAMVTGGLATFVMLADNAPGVMTKYVVHVLLEGCGVATCGLALWGMLFGKKEQRLTQLGLVTVSAVCCALMVGIAKMIK